MSTAIQTWIETLVGRAGYVGLAVLMLVENLVPPIPSEAILPLSGFLVGIGRFEFGAVLAASTAGSVAGASLLYVAGRWIGETRLRRLLRRWGGRVGFAIGAFDRSAELLRRYASPVLFWGRFVPGLRSVLSIPAGVVQIPFAAFLFWTGMSALCWNTLLIGAGWWLGSQWHRVAVLVDRYGVALLALGTAAGVLILAVRRSSARRARRPGPGSRPARYSHVDC